MLGATPVRGLVLATGHFRNGILLAPITAEAIAELVADGPLGDRSGAVFRARFALAAPLRTLAPLAVRGDRSAPSPACGRGPG